MATAVFLGTVISGLVRPQIPESPCPHVFQYKSYNVPGENSGTVIGMINITTPPFETDLKLLVHLQLQAVLPSKYVGFLEIADNFNLTTRSNSIFYRVLFPLVQPLPTVHLISVNSKVICSGLPVSGPVVTDIRLEHTLLWKPQNSVKTPVPAIDNETTRYNIDPGGECGRTVTANPLVVGGHVLRRGQWPWLAAIFVLNSLGLQFHCSGSIITHTFILTVGHCMHHEEAGVRKASGVVVYLGKFNLQQWEEPHSVIKEVSAIHIHPDFDPYTFHADLALLQLKTTIEYNNFIQPVCLWDQSPLLDLIVGRTGTVVGWGKDHLGNNISLIPRILEIPIVSREECVNSHSEFFFLTSSRTLCAGGRNGIGPCSGDSGGGLMLPVTVDNITRWHLRGLVSLSLLNRTTQSCDLSQFIVFTDTAKFLPWIASVIN